MRGLNFDLIVASTQTEFRDVLVKMVTIGYNRVSCSDAACKLVKR
jgi:hypothetical protein